MNPAASIVLETGLHGKNLSKGQLRQKKIIESGIDLFYRDGLNSSKLVDIAEKAEATRTIINHYYKNKEGLFIACITYIREDFQRRAIQGVDKLTKPEEILESYLSNTISWGLEKPKYSSLWIYFFYRVSSDIRLKKLNTQFVETGTERITYFLSQTGQTGDLSRKAHLLQNLLIGFIIGNATEINKSKKKEIVEKQTEECLEFLKLEL
ncbi:MAG: TetR/AcrR family transcriptional regulator [Bdellovibrionales bacterium]